MPASQQEWQEFIDNMESGMSDVSQNVNSTLNDSSSTDTQKSSAAQDYAKQQMFLTRIKEMYANGDYNNPTNTFSVSGASSIYLSAKDAKYHVCALQPWSDAGQIASGAELTHDILLSDEFVVTSHMEHISSFAITSRSEEVCDTWWGASGQYQRVGCKFIATPYAYWHCWFTATGDYFNPLADTSNIITADGAGYYMCLYAKADLRLNQNTLAFNTFAGNGVWTGDGITLETCFATIIDIDSEEMENPWDYYNDNILPTISDNDNKAFPDGYQPSTPHDPPEEPDMDSSDEGDTPEYDPTTIITAPSLFITQYVLSNLLLRSLGETLWQSWLTPNTDIWENFLWDFASQTGTFNITAALDYIISLRVYPFDLHAIINPTPPEGFYGHSDGVYMGTGKTNFTYSSGVTNVITINSVNGYLNLGECVVKSTDAPFNDFRDMFNSSISCYLPFCGTIELNPVDVYGRKLRCSYFIDFQSGGCTALVECEGDTGWFPVGCKSGQIGFTLPLTATNAGQLAATFASDAVQAVGTLSGLYFNVGRSAANVASAIATKNVEASNTAMTAMNVGQSTVNAGLSLANQAMGIMSRSGVDMPLLSGGTGCETLAMYRTPFITIRRGKYAKPENFAHSVAYKNGTSSTISNYHGMTQFIGVDTTGLTCHDDEKEEILSLLQSGVYLP